MQPLQPMRLYWLLCYTSYRAVIFATHFCQWMRMLVIKTLNSCKSRKKISLHGNWDNITTKPHLLARWHKKDNGHSYLFIKMLFFITGLVWFLKGVQGQFKGSSHLSCVVFPLTYHQIFETPRYYERL